VKNQTCEKIALLNFSQSRDKSSSENFSRFARLAAGEARHGGEAA
jgi:hypothetical protein